MFRPVVDRVFEFSEAREALKTMDAATHRATGIEYIDRGTRQVRTLKARAVERRIALKPVLDQPFIYGVPLPASVKDLVRKQWATQMKDGAGKPVINSAANVKSVDLLMKWAEKDKILPAEPSTALITSLFNEGKAAIVFSGPWSEGAFRSRARGRRLVDELHATIRSYYGYDSPDAEEVVVQIAAVPRKVHPYEGDR